MDCEVLSLIVDIFFWKKDFWVFLLMMIEFSKAQIDLEVLRPNPNLTIIKPELDNGSQEITNNFLTSVQSSDDTLGTFLEFLKNNRSG